MKKGKQIFIKILKILGWFFVGVITLIVILLLFIRSPWGQNIIVSKATNYLEGEIGTRVDIGRLFFTFRGNLFIEDFYMEDQQGDTLFYTRSLETGVALWPLITSNEIHVPRLEWDGLRANVHRDEETERFNFDYIIDAFTSEEPQTEEREVTDEEGEPMKIELGPIRFSDFHLTYNDGVMGIESFFTLGQLNVDIERMDMEKMSYYISNVEFLDSEGFYKQTKPFEPTDEDTTEAGALPLLILDNFQVRNVKMFYESEPDGMLADVFLGDVRVNLPEADLEKNKILLKEFRLHDSFITFKTRDEMVEETEADTTEEPIEEVQESTPFEWPEWIVEIGEVSLRDNRILYQAGDVEPREGYFNPNAVAIDDFNLVVSNLFLKDQEAGLRLDRFDFVEKSGFRLDEFGLKINVSERAFDLANLSLKTNKSTLQGDVGLTYASLQDLMDNPENSGMRINIPTIRLFLDEAFVFAPELRQNEYFVAAAQHPLRGNLNVTGNLSELQIPSFELRWADRTRLIANGLVRNPLDEDKLFLNFDKILFESEREELLAFVNEEEMGVRLPKNIRLESNVTGSPSEIEATADLILPDSRINLGAYYKDQDQLVYRAKLDVIDLNLGQLLMDPEMGMLSFSLESEGQGRSLNELDAYLTSDFRTFQMYGQDLSDLSISGTMKNGRGDLELELENDHLDFDFTGWVNLDSVYTEAEIILDLKGADLYELGMTSDILRASGYLTATFEGNLEDYNVTARIEEGAILKERRLYSLGPFGLTARIKEDSTSVDLSSEMLFTKLRSNSSPEELVAGIQRQFRTYLSDSVYTDTIGKPVEMRMEMAFWQTQLLNEVFLPGLEEMDSLFLEVDFNEAENIFAAEMLLPYVNYSNLEIDSIGFRVNGVGDDLRFGFGLVALETGPVSMGRTYFSGEVEGDRLFIDFNSFDGEERLIHLATDIGYRGDTLSIHIDPEDLVFNKRTWDIPQDNEIQLADQFINFNNFIWSRANQRMHITCGVEGIEEDHVGVTFENFQLSTFLTLLNPDEPLASGALKGRLVVKEPFGATGILADLNINELRAMDVLLGNLSLDAKSVEGDQYDFNLALKDGGIDLDLVGDYIADPEGARLNLNLDINEVLMEVITGLSGDQLLNGEGYLSGNVDVQGTTADLEYDGVLKFSGAAFTVAELNSRFKLSEEDLRVDNSGLYVNKFTILDEKGDAFTLDGEVLTEDMANPTFDLRLTASNFQVINSTSDDNELFFGRAAIDADVTIGGDLNLPVIDGRLKVREGTKLTFIVPETQLDLVERDGTVIFVNRSDPDDIMTRKIPEAATNFSGFRLTSILGIDRNAEFNVVVDERSGDNLRVVGEADLSFDIDPNGRMYLSGSYEIMEGHYEMSLYQLVNRRFELYEGSRITWSGDPMDAMLDISAIYRIRTSPSELMSSQLTGADADMRNRYRQELPFMVFLNVEGEMLRPEISFGLDMPEEQRGAIGGNVYTRVQQVNQQEDELNRQVFSLLVLNRFFPDTGGDGTGGGMSTLARSSVSQVLSGQLNDLAGNLLGGTGIELDFDLDSFQDYQTGAPQDRTQLNVSARKRMMDDRLIVQVGSQMDIEGSSQMEDQSSQVIGNVSVEYLLTENGRYRLRGFRRNQFESIVDGQLIVTGISVIFNREFNMFRELWSGSDLSKQGDPVNPISKKEEENRNGEKEKRDRERRENNSNNTPSRTEENQEEND
ncbi:translocation/assembly module TamB domain-containing protein [Litoribacter ruber]|uniref:translocation/assembly module TamB domain-containing protein n=1 Tax=Litoribacter ruber TaxID=702568 RepID=UPI001FE7C2E6|nr:translocation/assembly module TamB [Litoribacter alkaliphilus]